LDRAAETGALADHHETVTVVPGVLGDLARGDLGRTRSIAFLVVCLDCGVRIPPNLLSSYVFLSQRTHGRSHSQ
jgi:hypothetical protein